MVEENEQNFQCLELTDSSLSIHSVDTRTELYSDAMNQQQQQYYAHEHCQQQQQQTQSNRRGSSVSSGTSVSSNSAATSSLTTTAMEITSVASNEPEP